MLHVLLVEDDPTDLEQHERDLPSVFDESGVKAILHGCDNFDDAFEKTDSPLGRYDMIISDTYRGPTDKGDAAVLRMLDRYRGSRFCPLVIYSSGVKPSGLPDSPFVLWADKGVRGDIERAVKQLLDSGIPQIARSLQADLERSTGSYLWSFLEESWDELNRPGKLDRQVLEQMIRRRAAVQIGDIDPASNSPRSERHASEYYLYPVLDETNCSLGDILRSKTDRSDLRVLLTPHCHLVVQPGQTSPRADHVLLVKALPATSVLGEKLDGVKDAEEHRVIKKLTSWAQSPARTEIPPEGRHWLLPGFLGIPHSFCDLMQVESMKYANLEQFDRIATLMPPYAEALQSCFAAFYSQVGIPNIQTQSIFGMLGR